MKRLLILTLVLSALLVLTNCGTPPTTVPDETSVPTDTTDTPSTTVPDETSVPTDTTDELEVHFIDVGQGDSILIDLGETEILIDGGDKSPGVTTYLKQYVDEPLEVMVATHPHADHIGGLIGVLEDFEVQQIWLNGDTTTSETYSQFMSAVNSEGAQVYEARRGDTIEVGELIFNVLNPASLDDTTNNNSIVLSLSYGENDFLFMGDAEKEAEASMLAAGVVQDIGVLKVGHHGSRTASSLDFLNVVKPEIAIYMAGTGNSYGHPHQETIDALTQIGAEIYGTDICGTIVVTSDGKSPTFQSEKQCTPVVVEEEETQGDNLFLTIVSVTPNPIGQGYTATLLAKTVPGAYCTITVYYKSGSSTAAGLYPKEADSQGNVSWSWKVGTRTTPGSWPIVVTASIDDETVSQQTSITVY